MLIPWKFLVRIENLMDDISFIMGISIFILNNAPGTITGAFPSNNQLITLISVRFILSRSPECRERSSHLQNHCGSNKTRTCDKRPAYMYHHVCAPVLYQLSYTANYLRRAHVYCAKIALIP